MSETASESYPDVTPCSITRNTQDVERFQPYASMRVRRVFDPKTVNAFDEAEFLASMNLQRN